MSNKNYDIDYLRKYLNGELNAEEMYTLERAAQDDPMLADILMGLEFEKEKDLQNPLTWIQDEFENKSIPKSPKIIPINWKWISIAASLVILVGISLFYFQQNQKMDDRLASSDTATTELLDEKGLDSLNQESTAKSIEPTAKDQKKEQQSAVVADKIAPNLKNDSRLNNVKEEIHTNELVIQNKPNYPKIENQIVYDKNYSKEIENNFNQTERLDISPKITENQFSKNKNIIIGRIGAGPNSNVFNQGIIVDAETNEPIPGVSLRLKNSNYTTTTDSLGHYTIPILATDSIADIYAIGYNSKKINYLASNNKSIKLSQQNNSLEEVVVLNSRKKTKSPDTKLNHQNFKNYIASQAKLKGLKGKVKISFELDNDGKAAEIQILESSNPSINEALIQIINNAPNWQKEKNSATPIQLSFKF